MLRSVALATLGGSRRSLAWWSLGIVALIAMYAAIYPTIRDMPDIQELLESYPEQLRAFFGIGDSADFGRPEVYLQTEAFSFMLPIMFAAFAIAAGSAAIAGEEERGTLELLLATPLTRRRLVLEKLGAIAGGLAALSLVLWLSLWLGALASGMEISAGNLAAGTIELLLFALVLATLALLVGAATGRRGLSIAVAAAAGLAAYVVHSLAALVDFLEVPQRLSPYYYYTASDPLANGLDPWHALVLLALATVFAALALPAFERRDVSAA